MDVAGVFKRVETRLFQHAQTWWFQRVLGVWAGFVRKLLTSDPAPERRFVCFCWILLYLDGSQPDHL